MLDLVNDLCEYMKIFMNSVVEDNREKHPGITVDILPPSGGLNHRVSVSFNQFVMKTYTFEVSRCGKLEVSLLTSDGKPVQDEYSECIMEALCNS